MFDFIMLLDWECEQSSLSEERQAEVGIPFPIVSLTSDTIKMPASHPYYKISEMVFGSVWRVLVMLQLSCKSFPLLNACV